MHIWIDLLVVPQSLIVPYGDPGVFSGAFWSKYKIHKQKMRNSTYPQCAIGCKRDGTPYAACRRIDKKKISLKMGAGMGESYHCAYSPSVRLGCCWMANEGETGDRSIMPQPYLFQCYLYLSTMNLSWGMWCFLALHCWTLAKMDCCYWMELWCMVRGIPV